MQIIIVLLVLISIFLLYKNRSKVFADKRIIITIIIVAIILVSLRFGQHLFAIIVALLPILLRTGMFLIRNIGIFNFIKYFSKMKNKAAPKVTLSKNEAYDILGLKPGASKDEIMSQYRNLMKQNHPDKGGSKHLSILINQAKDTLLS